MTPQTEPRTKPGPTGPRTEEGKSRCRLNAFSHGLTSQVFVFTADEAPVYHKHHADIAKYYQPVGPLESALVDQISAGIWRLQRAHAIEEGLFATTAAAEPEPADGIVTSASIPGPARAWIEQGKSFDLLGKYERRIRHSLDRDKSELAALQSARKQQAAEAMDRAITLHRLSQFQGKPYDPAPYFQEPPSTPESVFSAEKVSAESSRREALAGISPVPRQLKAA